MNRHLENYWWGIELHLAVVTYDTLSWVGEDYCLSSQSFYELSEDLLQIEFPQKKLIIDVGWYNPFATQQGFFQILVIQNMDWEKPLFSKNFRKINTLKKCISKLITQISDQNTLKINRTKVL